MLIIYANGIAIVSTSQSVRGESSVNECIAWDRLILIRRKNGTPAAVRLACLLPSIGAWAAGGTFAARCGTPGQKFHAKLKNFAFGGQ